MLLAAGMEYLEVANGMHPHFMRKDPRLDQLAGDCHKQYVTGFNKQLNSLDLWVASQLTPSC